MGLQHQFGAAQRPIGERRRSRGTTQRPGRPGQIICSQAGFTAQPKAKLPGLRVAIQQGGEPGQIGLGSSKVAQPGGGQCRGIQGRCLSRRWCAQAVVGLKHERPLGICTRVGQGPRPRRKQPMLQQRRRPGCAGRLQNLAALHIGDTLGGQGVAAQVRKGAAVVQTGGLLQLLKHAGKTLPVKACFDQHRIAHPVGFAFHVARKIKLALGRGGLPTHNQGVGRIGAFAGCQRAQNHGSDHPGRLLILASDQARDMALGHMAEFVGQHRGEFVSARHAGQKPQVQAKVAPRQCKSIHRAVAPQHDLPSKTRLQVCRQVATRTGCRQQRLPDRLHILGQHRVVQIVWIAVKLSGNAVAQASLGAAAQLGVAQRRQRRCRYPPRLRQSGPGATGGENRQHKHPQQQGSHAVKDGVQF